MESSYTRHAKLYAARPRLLVLVLICRISYGNFAVKLWWLCSQHGAPFWSTNCSQPPHIRQRLGFSSSPPEYGTPPLLLARPVHETHTSHTRDGTWIQALMIGAWRRDVSVTAVTLFMNDEGSKSALLTEAKISTSSRRMPLNASVTFYHGHSPGNG